MNTELLKQEAAGIESQTATHKGLWVVLLGLKPYRDGNQYCFLWGDNLQEGIAGFGDTVAKAMWDFEKNMTTPAASGEERAG